MKIDNIKDLERVIKILRRTGVEIAKFGDIEIVLGANPVKATRAVKSPTVSSPAYQIDENTAIHTPDSLTPEQLLMWSTGQDNPEQN